MKNSFLFLFIFLVTLVACRNQVTTPQEFEARVYSSWAQTFQISEKNQRLLDGNVISQPHGIEEFLLRLTMYGKDSFEEVHHCLFYRIPSKGRQGEFSVYALKRHLACDQYEDGQMVSKIENISRFQILLSESDASFESKKIKAFHLMIKFEREGKEFVWEFPLYNLRGKAKIQKFDSYYRTSAKKALAIYQGSPDDLISFENHYLGEKSDHYSNRSAIKCHQVNSKCDDVIKNHCGECKWGWYQVVDYKCPQGGTKFCGVNRCGEAGEPACPRGFSAFEKEFQGDNDLCFDESPFGICRGELVSTCNSEHVLVCK